MERESVSMPRNLLLESKGLSLVEILVVMALVGGIAAAMSSMIGYSLKSQKNVQLNTDRTNLENSIQLALRDNALCANALQDSTGSVLNYSGTEVQVQQIMAGPVVVAKTSTTDLGVRVSSMSLIPVQDLGPFIYTKWDTTVVPPAPTFLNYHKYLAQLKVVSEKVDAPGQSTFMGSKHREVLFNVTILSDTTGKIAECFADDSAAKACDDMGGIFDSTQNPRCMLQRLSIGTRTQTPGNLLVNGANAPAMILAQTESSGANNTPTYLATQNFAGTDGATSFGSLLFMTAQGSQAAPTAVAANRVVGQIAASGWDGAAWGTAAGTPNGAAITFQATQNYTSTAHGSRMDFRTIPNGSVNQQIRMAIDQNGNVGIGETAPAGILDIKYTSTVSGGGMKLHSTDTQSQLALFGPSDGGATYSALYLADNTYPDHSKNSWVIAHKANAPTDAVADSFQINRWKDHALSVQFSITPAGNVGIGTWNPSQKLEVAGGARITGSVTVGGTVTSSSDERLKKDIAPIPGALDKLLSLKGYFFQWKDESREAGRQIGLKAQEVQKTFPEAVRTDSQGFLTVAYQNLIAPVIEAIRELRDRLLGQDGRISRLEAENTRIRTENAEIKSENARIKAAICEFSPKAEFCRTAERTKHRVGPGKTSAR